MFLQENIIALVYLLIARLGAYLRDSAEGCYAVVSSGLVSKNSCKIHRKKFCSIGTCSSAPNDLIKNFYLLEHNLNFLHGWIHNNEKVTR